MRWKLYISLVLVAAMVGCAGTHQKTQREAAQKQWNGARASVLYGLAKDQYSTGNFDKARQTVDEGLKLDPNNEPMHVLAAKLAIEQGQLEAAEIDLKEAQKLKPKDAEPDYLMGVVYQRWQKPDAALQCYLQASDKAPAELAYIMARAEMLVAMDRQKEALALLQEKVVYFEHSPVIRDAVGQLLMQMGRTAEAVDMFRSASILATDDLSLREHLALAQYANKQYSDAGETLARLTADSAYAKRADLLSALGECQLQTGRVRDARDTFETASQLAPASASVWLGVAKSALQLGDTRRAEMSLKKAISLDGTSSESQLLLGYMRLNQKKLNEALLCFRKASALDPRDPVSICMIGLTLEKQGHADQAIECYARALKVKPGDELATRLMASMQE
jgi:tetratricopeptide (TPR) repeat protein